MGGNIMLSLPKQKWAKILVAFCYTIIGILCLYLLFSKIFAIILPFVMALAVGRALQNPVEKLHQRLHLPSRLIGFVLTLTVILFFIFVFALITNQFISEAQGIFLHLSENADRIVQKVTGFFEGFTAELPFVFERLDRDVTVGAAGEAVNNIISNLTAGLAQLLTSAVKAIPGVILFLVVFIIASFYFSMDYCRIKEKIKKLIPQSRSEELARIKKSLRTTALKYIKAYSLILLITFAELFVGFIIIGNKYALVLALIIALLDMLPVIGTGTILLPWALTEYLTGDRREAVSLAVIFAVISIVREFIEPKIVGDCIGMHPLLTLFSMYTGYKLFGVLGLVLLPLIIMIIKNSIYEDKISSENNNNT